MRISYFNYHYDVAGTAIGCARQIESITAGLTRLGHQVDLQFRNSKQPGAENQYLGLKGVGWARRFGHVPNLLARNVRLVREEVELLHSFQPDVVLAVSGYINCSALIAARKLHLPFVLFIEAPMEYEYTLFFQEYYAYPLLGRWLEGMMVRGAQQVICISEVLKGYLMRYGVPAAKLHVVPNGVDQVAFCPQPADREIIDRFNLHDRLVVGYVGSFEYFGDVLRWLGFIKAMCPSHPDLIFLFVGEGRFGPDFRRRVADFGLQDRFVFPGSVPHDQVPRYLSAMDIVISPYREDYLFYGSSMKLLEYMAFGKPVLFPALGQIKEVVADGYNGMLYEPGDHDAMRNKLVELIEDRQLRSDLGANARKTIERNWTWDRQTACIAKVLQLAAEER
jgi:glycosyltransferase involved in cell wall biosynthesis